MKTIKYTRLTKEQQWRIFFDWQRTGAAQKDLAAKHHTTPGRARYAIIKCMAEKRRLIERRQNLTLKSEA